MTFIKIDDVLYPAKIDGKMRDLDWDNRESKAITLEMDYATASAMFVYGLAWSIVQEDEVPVYDENGEQTGTETKMDEYDNSEFCLAGDITDHRDGTVTCKMGKLTDLEEAYEIMLGGM
jgi:hypothetical protein